MAALRSILQLRFDLLANHPHLLPLLAPDLIHAEVAIRQIDRIAYQVEQS